MFAIQRQETILRLLNENGTIQVNELVKLLKVSDVTIRKDLNKLQADGLITKTHGGAVLNRNSLVATNAPNLNEPNANTKLLLANKVTEYLQDGETLFLGSGNTCTAFARYMGHFDDLCIITNNIEAIPHLRDKCKTVILIGGEVIYHESHTFSSSRQIENVLMDFNISKAITSCTGIDLKGGISVSTEVSRNLFTAVLKAAHSWLLIADDAKFNVVSPYKIDDVTRPDFIFTDSVRDDYKAFGNIHTINLFD